MKIISLLGVSRSGKTTTGEMLIAELKRRGYRVGCCKSIGHPGFSLESGKHDTYRLREAGADVICMRGDSETDICYPRALEGNEVFSRLDVDWLLLEGDYASCVPAILCAHTKEEAAERLNERTILIAGPAATGRPVLLGRPAFDGLREIGQMADFLEITVPDTVFPVQSDRSGSRHNGVRFGDRTAQVLQKKRQNRKPAQNYVLLKTSDSKETAAEAWERMMPPAFEARLKRMDPAAARTQTMSPLPAGAGFCLIPYEIGGSERGFVMHSLKPVRGFSNDLPVLQKAGAALCGPEGLPGNGPEAETAGGTKWTALPEVLNTFGCAVLLDAAEEKGPVWLDRILPEMKAADAFWRTLSDCLMTGPGLVLVCEDEKLAEEWKGAVSCTVLEY